MSVVQIGTAEANAAIEAAAAQASALIRSIPNPDVPGRRLGWTVGEIATHLVIGCRIYTDWATGRGRPDWGVDEIAAYNARFIEQLPERSGAALAEMLVEGARSLRDATAGRPGDEPFPWYEGSLPLACAMGIVLGELLVHGYDIAKSTGRPWAIDPRQASLVIDAMAMVLPRFVNPRTARGVTASYDIRIRRGSRFVARFDQGTLTIGPADSRPVDCHILADPVAFLLVGYGRISQWGPIARGKMLAWGRKPRLGFKFTSLLKKP